MTNSIFEAQLAIHTVLTEILVSLAVDDDTTDGDAQLLEADMGEVASMMIESLELKVIKVNTAGNKFTATIEIREGEEDPD